MPVDRRITREIESGSRGSARSGASRAFPGSRRVVRRRPVAGARWDTPWFGFARASSRSGSGGRRQPPVARAAAGPDPPREGASPQTVAVLLRTVHSCDSLPQGVLHFLWFPCPNAVWQACIIACGCPAAGTLQAPPFGLVCERVEEAAVEVAAPVVLGQAETIQVHDRRDAHRLHVRAADRRRSAVEARTLHHRFPAPSCIPAPAPLLLTRRRKRGLRSRSSNCRAACLGRVRRAPAGVEAHLGGLLSVERRHPPWGAGGTCTVPFRAEDGAVGGSPPSRRSRTHLAGAISAAGFRS